MNGRIVREAMSPVLFMLAVVGVIALAHHACGCDSAATQAQRVKNAADVTAYTDALNQCRKEGREFNSYAVYERCAKEADIRYGVDGGAP